VVAFLHFSGLMSVHGVRRDKAALSSGCKPHPATAPAGNRSSHGGNEVAEALSVQAATRVNAEQASKRTMCRPTRLPYRGRLKWLGALSEDYAHLLHRGIGGGVLPAGISLTAEDFCVINHNPMLSAFRAASGYRSPHLSVRREALHI
jgi:hypothetical protein